MFHCGPKKYHWVDCLSPDAEQYFSLYLQQVLPKNSGPLVFLCVGTPLLCGDSLGPHIGSSLASMGLTDVFGTMTQPVHAENIEQYRNLIYEKYPQPTIVAIDAALGTKAQTGYITLRRGALHPGKALGKNIAPIGTIEINGIFDSICNPSCKPVLNFMSTVIINGVYKIVKKM